MANISVQLSKDLVLAASLLFVISLVVLPSLIAVPGAAKALEQQLEPFEQLEVIAPTGSHSTIHRGPLTVVTEFRFPDDEEAVERVSMPDVPSLAELFRPSFSVGFATDTIPYEAHDLIAHHFNVVTSGNSLKWDAVQSRPGSFDFVRPDALVAWASQRGLDVIGHTLVWHQQTPAWVFQGEGGEPPTRELLLERMREHIHTVVGRYCGRIRGWDVVNEALEENGSLRDSPWRRIIGDDYIEWAFRFAHEACPSAELYYNDYNLTTPAKRQGAVRIVRHLQELGIPVHAVGEQGHFDLYSPSPAELRATIQTLAGLGVKVLITELDMSAYSWTERRDLYAGGFPRDLAKRQAQRYAEFFSIFLDHADVIDRVTFWGTTDRYSWKNDFPVVGRTDHPLLFDREGYYKPAFWAVVEVGRAAQTSRGD